MTAGEEDLSPAVKCVIEDCGYSSVWDEFAGQLKEMFGLPTFPVLDAASLVTQIRAGYGFKEASAAVKKRQKDISDIDQKIISMYAKGMTTRQISETIEDTLSVQGGALYTEGIYSLQRLFSCLLH